MEAVAILKNHKNRDITPTDWPIFAKFGMIMQIGPLRGETVKISKFWKSKMAERKQQPTTEGETEVLLYKIKCTSRSQVRTQENKKANINVKKLNSLNMVLEAKSHV